MAAVDVVFAIRGILSFAAFTELSTGLRCLVSVESSYLQTRLFTGVSLPEQPVAAGLLSHVYGLYCFLNALIIIHTSIFAHYSALVCLCASALILKLLFLLSEAFLFGSIATGRAASLAASADAAAAPETDPLLFPLIICLVSLAATLSIPFYTADQYLGYGARSGDENAELLRKMKLPKKKKKV